ncbi:hypothetical protein UPYG_G00218940 [Umbra pygmaea]|uniref:Synaptopodin n=1 Tax=Umbra pygmaea TaxID=75934 RepID=A0ABD0WM87_UMBPY
MTHAQPTSLTVPGPDSAPRTLPGLTRSASLSETELKEARERSQIIATQLTIPSGGSSSRGVQLFNRRRQRVNAFTLDSCGGGAGKDEEAEHADTRNNNLTWREGRRDDSEIHRETDKVLNVKNKYRTKPLPWSPPSGGSIESEVAGSDIMKDPGDEHIYEEVDVAQHRHFHPVKESEEDDRVRDEEREREEIYDDAESAVKDGISPVNENHNCTLREEGGPTGWTYTELTTPTETQNGFHITQCTMGKIQNGGAVSVSQSGLNPTIVNRTARPFFSPSTVQATAAERTSIPPAPCYPTPTLPTAPSYSSPPFQTFSPAPPPPSYPTPPLPVFPNHPLSPIDPVSSPNPVTSARATHVSQHPPPTCPKPITFIPYTPQPVGQQFQQEPIKTGILEEGAAAIRRSSTARKSMFTFKEKPIVTPNPELLSLVQGNDERKKYGLRSISDQPLDEELLALGAEASNFLAAEEVRAEAAKVPEWSSCLKSSRTREPRGQHQPEQTLTNVSGKGAELFAKRQSRMEKYVVENKNAPGSGAHMRSLSPTSSLPPSWIYPSNMPGRVKAIVNNTDLNAQLARPLQTVQQVKRRPSQQAPAPAPVPEEPPLENGCTKIEMDLSRHRPYQLNPSLFIFNPVKDPTSTLPRGAPPPPRPLVTAGSFSSLPSNNYNSLPHCRPSQSTPSQSTTRGVGGGDYYPPQHRGTTGPSEPRITSPLSGFSEEKVGSPRPGTQAPCPTFSAKRAGIEAQVWSPSVFYR